MSASELEQAQLVQSERRMTITTGFGETTSRGSAGRDIMKEINAMRQSREVELNGKMYLCG